MKQSASKCRAEQVVAVLLTLGALLLLAWMLLPLLVGGGPSIGGKIRANLTQIDLLKHIWAEDHSLTAGMEISEQDLASLLPAGSRARGIVVPVAGEQYRVNPVGVPAEAILRHPLGKKYPAGSIIRSESWQVGDAALSNKTVQGMGTSPSVQATNGKLSTAGSHH